MARAIHLRALCLALLAIAARADCQQAWRYGLKAGDHLVYSETLEKETVGPTTHYKTTATFENHILVLDDSPNTLIFAVQRNRKSAELLHAAPGKKPPTDSDLKSFTERMAKWPTRVADANQISRSGGLQFATGAIREWPSRALIGFEEFPFIQVGTLKAGDKWRGGGFLDPGFVVKEVTAGQPSTALVEGSALGGHVLLSYRFGQDAHDMRLATYDAEYGVSSGTVHEHVSLTLNSATHDETPTTWLASPQTRLAALAALERFTTLATFVGELRPMLDSGDAEAATLALSIIARRRLPLDAGSLKAPTLTAEGERLLAMLRRGEKLQPPPFPAGATIQLYLIPERGFVPFIIRIPRDFSLDRPSPLLAYLSGAPGVALDALNNSLAPLAGSEFAALYPNALGMWWEPESTAMFDGLLTKVVADLRVPPQKTYLAGFSNGGSGTEFYAARWPNRFGAAVSLMGAGECGVLDGHAVEQLVRVPLLLVHGRTDTIIPSDCSQQLFRKLQKKRANVRLELLDKGHEITIDSDQGLTMDFLRRATQTVPQAAAQ